MVVYCCFDRVSLTLTRMSSVIEEFVAFPSEILLERCTKEELVKIAEHFSVELTSNDKKLKETLINTLKSAFFERGVLKVRDVVTNTNVNPEDIESSSDDGDADDSNVKVSEMSLKEKQLCIDAEKVRAERDALSLKEKELEKQFDLRKLELQLERDRDERQFQLRKLELELNAKTAQISATHSVSANESGSAAPVFDVFKNIRMVPPFSEKEVEKYFSHFERVAESLKWPKEFWTLLLQCVLTGRAQEVYSALTVEQSREYETVKSTLLQAYELAPEAYRQRFRSFFKSEKCTYLEFAREKVTMFDRWCSSMKVSTYEQLRELILLEEFKHCVPDAVAMYLNEHKLSKLSDAALMADEFVLTHRGSFNHLNDLHRSKSSVFGKRKTTVVRQNVVSHSSPDHSSPGHNVATHVKGEIVCFYCKKAGHKISDCVILKKKERSAKTVGLISTSRENHISAQFVKMQKNISEVDDVKSHNDYAPFLTDGTVSLPGSEKTVPVCVLRDTGASQSFILEGLLPLSDSTATGTNVLVRGIEMGFMEVPLHRIHLNSKLVSGDVVVGVRSVLPVPGVTVILGNDLAGGNVWEKSDDGVPPIVVPAGGKMYDSSDCHNLYPACAITRAKAKKISDDREINLSDTLIFSVDSSQPGSNTVCTGTEDKIPVSELQSIIDNVVKSDSIPESFVDCGDHVNTCSLSPLYSVSRDELIKEQQSDGTLQDLFPLVNEGSDQNSLPVYFLRNGLLCRKQPINSDSLLDPRIQIVVPATFRQAVLQLSHEGVAGHMGVRKTYDRILREFYWPRVKCDVINFIRSCHTCQVTGKPNQKIPLAPLQPIAAVTTPFEHLIIDCVGPLPRSKAGHAYLLTVMCQSTRYPAAYPLRSITTKSILKALTSFMSIFGIPKIIQSDRGSNFMSRNFSKVMQQLKVTHNISSAYHPQSQGVLERFHQTLKSLLRSYCVELDCDWEEGLPWMLLAIREVVQESIGFSPNELVFGHTVRGPITVLADEWKTSDPPENVLDYVSSFRYRVYEARAIAQRKLGKSQGKMQRLFDRKVKFREFQVGDQVLAVLPVLTSPFQARFMGPYTIAKCFSNNNYLLNTPDRRKKLQVCHINLLKPYMTPVTSLPVDIVSTTVGQSTSEVSDEIGPEFSPSRGVVEGRLRNSEVLADLSKYLSHLSESEKTEIIKLVSSFPSLFSDVPTRTHVIEHDIDVGVAQSVKQHAYRVNPIKRELLQKEVDYLLAHNLAEPSFSSWSSPCILVNKPDGTYRFCTDYRKLNTLTKPDCYPLPRIDDCVDRVGSAQYVSKFDLLKGYWQVPLTSRAKELSAFVTPDRFLQYTVMPFGVRNAPATFQRLVNRVLSGLSGCEAYLDDVVLFSSSWSEHLDQIKELFVRLAEANLTVNLAKCEFGKATVTYLGKVVGRGHVKPIDAKVYAISSFPTPSTRRELRRFLGMVGYYRGFCKNFASVVTPLTDLLSPKKSFQWSEKCQSSFNNAKALLANAPVLAAPDFKKPFLLAVDASASGAGAVLLQQDADEIAHPVSYFSKKFNRHQQAYSTVEKEALALVLAVQHFEVYLSSICGPIVVYTDHNPLTFLDRMRGKNQRIMRWSLILQPFHLLIKHIRGKDNLIADALSRV